MASRVRSGAWFRRSAIGWYVRISGRLPGQAAAWIARVVVRGSRDGGYPRRV